MSFANNNYFIVIILAIIAFVSVMYLYHTRYFRWIKKYWNYEGTWWSKLSLLFYVLSFSLFLFSLLDLRGPEEKIKTSIPDQKTIIIMDSSASMLAEDIRPNRFGKAIQMARHFVKNAPGHQISIVLFSDVQKRLIPFTDDIDLLDSRLAALEKTNAVGGGSNISQAIKEAVGYFLLGGESAEASGNILVFTDAEESEGSLDIALGSKINLAVVGIGTAKGSTIPLRWDDGTFRGYKNTSGENVITKLDEEYIKKLGKGVRNYKYWIANSYALPTEEIKNFFRSSFSINNAQGDISIRPVLSQKIVIPAIILYCLGVVFGRLKSFKAIVSFGAIVILTFSINGHAAEGKPKEKEIPDGIKKELIRMKNGDLDRTEILKIAENFLKNEDPDRALAIYNDYSTKDDEVEVVFNRATGLLQKGDLKKASPYVQEVLLSSASDEVKDLMRSNVLLAMKQEDQKNQNQNKEQENKKQDGQGEGDDQKDQNGEDESDEKKDDGKSGKGKNDKKDDKNDKKDKADKQDEKSNEPKDLDRPDESDEPQTIEEKEKQIEQQRKMIKTPAMIRQILNDDRELQKKMMDTSTNEKGASRPKRDW